LEKVYLLKYPWVNGVVLADVGERVMVKFTRGDCYLLLRSELGKGHLVEGFDEVERRAPVEWAERLRKGATEAVKDEVVDDEVGDV